MAVAFNVVMEFMAPLDANPNITNQYKSQMFGKLFHGLQRHFFPTSNPNEVMGIIDEMDVMRTQMKGLISEQILKEADIKAGGVGLDKKLGGEDNLLTKKSEKQTEFNADESMQTLIDFYAKDIPKMGYEEAVKIIMNLAKKTIQFKDTPDEDLKKLIEPKIKGMKKSG